MVNEAINNMMTLNQAIETAKTGNWNKAWEIAQRDSGMLSEVKKKIWIKFAKKTIAQREAEAAIKLEGWD